MFGKRKQKPDSGQCLAWETFAQLKYIQASGARRARRGNVDGWHTGGCVRQGRRDQRSLFLENFVAVAMRPNDLTRAAVD